MCGRFTLLSYEEVLQVIDSIAAPDVSPADEMPRDGGMDVTAGQQAFVIADSPTGLQPMAATWGLQFRSGGQLAINARLESARKPGGMWVEPFVQGRCIVPARRFFEPHHTEMATSPKTGKPMRRQYCFEPVIRPFLLMAGVMSQGRFAVVTTEPTEDVAAIHPRMPLLLEPEDAPLWLFGGAASLDMPFGTRLAIEPEFPDEVFQSALF